MDLLAFSLAFAQFMGNMLLAGIAFTIVALCLRVVLFFYRGR